MILQGIAASDGVGLGRAVCVREETLDYSEVRYSGKEAEKERLQTALEEFEDRTDAMAQRIQAQVGEKEAEILMGQITMLADPFMHTQMEEAIDNGSCAEAAVDAICTMYADMFAGVEDGLMRQRATDVKDIRDRLLAILLGVTGVDLSRIPAGSVLVARALELPAVLSVPKVLDLIEDGDGLIVDGSGGRVILDPDENTRSEYLRRQQEFMAKRAALGVYRDQATVDADGKSYHLYANIGAFIAWGLIAYTGGKVVGGPKGAVTGALAALGALGAIASTDSTMFIGAMICGPLGGWCIKKFDEKMEGHIPAGFEMVVNNFSVGIIGGILAIFAIGPACVFLTDILGMGVSFLVEHGLLPLTAVLVEPAKVQAVPASTGAPVSARDVRKIVFACDAGMGSSAMGATMLRNKLKDVGVTGIEVIHHPVSDIPGDCQTVVTHHELSGPGR